MQRTFYQRPLPTSCTAFSSEQGKLFFRSALEHNGLKSFYSLIEQYSTQTEPAFCGLATLVVSLNALAVDPRQVWKGPWRWYEESMLNCCLDLHIVKETGVNLRQFECMAHCQGLATELYYTDETGLSEFRNAVRRACVEDHRDDPHSSSPILAVSYSRRVLGQTGSGHFSPVAAYDQVSDQVLILDVARFKYGAHWVPLPLLYEAMQPLDPDTSRSRGYLLLSGPPQHAKNGDDKNERKETLQPALLLFSPMEQRDARQAFKNRFLVDQRLEPTFGQILDYCTSGGKDWGRLWELTQVQLRPCVEDNANDQTISIQDLVDKMVEILEDLVRSEKGQAFETAQPVEMEKDGCCRSKCRPNFGRTHPVTATQVAYLVYLSVLEEDKRRGLLYSAADATSVVDGVARDQLLHEAHLLRTALDVSDTDVL
ncbi:glutathione gamma-glutamylcysteinyltransferase [Fistulifera solaris]|jgi:glutathione gamma-glutamylcysteinyltransferase|uniref:glutathione gamma-glutamylcysteinyltransferase n=1 Tax=Fistulifera solaris TaxID=1519565 RepID=A0A1Z5K5M7_FISSO|nr:glutathione gamma-glutamylcysteinyltransferase [Fistulifera solaris]|eukprot:GAX21495.1 glutathione gamma-glutamylcysteinyltransferase [Fistulifera solaris]